MRGVTWRAVPAKFKTGMCEMKIFGSVGSGWVGTNAWCNMESCRDVWDESRKPKDAKFNGGSFWFRMGWHKCVVYYGERLPQKVVFRYANVENFGFCFANKALVRCGGGNWVPFSGGARWFYSLMFFLKTRWALLFSFLVPFVFLIFNIPQRHWV